MIRPSIGMPSKIKSNSSQSAGQPVPAVNVFAPQDGATYFEMLETLPKTVRAYLLSTELSKTRIRIYKEFGLSDKEQDAAYYTEHEIFFGTLSVSDFADALMGRLAWPKERQEDARRLSAEILGYVLLSAQAFVGDVEGAMRRLGGDPTKYPVKQLQARRLTYAQGAQEIVGLMQTRDEEVRRRLQKNIESHLSGVRTALQLREVLMKTKKTGGAELTEEDTERLLALVEEKKRLCDLVDELPVVAASTMEGATGAKFSAKEISRRYAGEETVRRAIAEASESFMKKTVGAPSTMRNVFYEVLYPPTRERKEPTEIAGALLAIAVAGALPSLLSDSRYAVIIRSYLSANGMEDELAQFADTPEAPKFLEALVQFILRGFAEFDEAESARLGMHVAARLKKAGQAEYAPDVAFDMNQGNFRWLNPVKL